MYLRPHGEKYLLYTYFLVNVSTTSSESECWNRRAIKILYFLGFSFNLFISQNMLLTFVIIYLNLFNLKFIKFLSSIFKFIDPPPPSVCMKFILNSLSNVTLSTANVPWNSDISHTFYQSVLKPHSLTTRRNMSCSITWSYICCTKHVHRLFVVKPHINW